MSLQWENKDSYINVEPSNDLETINKLLDKLKGNDFAFVFNAPQSVRLAMYNRGYHWRECDFGWVYKQFTKSHVFP
jgi:ADP-heptose:LPS heptosyltransferase